MFKVTEVDALAVHHTVGELLRQTLLGFLQRNVLVLAGHLAGFNSPDVLCTLAGLSWKPVDQTTN